MKIWVCLFLTLLTWAVGCAPGYYERQPGLTETGVTLNWARNPESEETYEMRISSEMAGH